MKTAISIDDGLLREADEAARRLGLSRSRLFAQAMDDFLQRQRSEQMLTQLNKVYTEGPQPNEQRLLRGMKVRVRHTVKDRW
jgi:metal-responsive CopG/Arc/MetJ family transcriptional regulator